MVVLNGRCFTSIEYTTCGKAGGASALEFTNNRDTSDALAF